MEIRKAEKTDVDALVALYHVLSSSYQGSTEPILAALKHSTTEIFVAEVDGAVVGTATISFRAVPCKGLVGYIDDVVVGTAGQGKGLGQILSERCLQEARDRGACRVELTSNPKRGPANSLYQKMGFQLRETNCYTLNLEQHPRQ